MATWARLEAEAAQVAAYGARAWPGMTRLQRGEPLPDGMHAFDVAYLATVRRDGGPRVHPFCPILAGGRLFAAIPRSSPKGWDLRRDPRCVVHALPGADDAELCIRARAREVDDAATRAAVVEVVARSGVGGMIESVAHDPIFELDLEQVDVARWVDVGQPGTHAERAQWRAG
jgi:hypothetical protein